MKNGLDISVSFAVILLNEIKDERIDFCVDVYNFKTVFYSFGWKTQGEAHTVDRKIKIINNVSIRVFFCIIDGIIYQKSRYEVYVDLFYLNRGNCALYTSNGGLIDSRSSSSQIHDVACLYF